MKQQAILEFKNITKKYPGTVALNDVSIDFLPGEVHALVGENGAGKSTLIKTCSGAITPTSGEIIIDGKKFDKLTPSLSQENGIAVIYQEFNLVNELSVAENVFLGCPIRKGIIPDMKSMERETQKILDRFQMSMNPKELVEKLSVGYQQMVEITKAISKNAKILIMDEPTAPLTTAEVDILMKIITQLKAEGVTIVYISHRLEEIFSISDRVSVLRDGELIKTMNTKDTDQNELIRLMVGRELKEPYPPRTKPASDEVILDVRHLTGNGVKDISFQVKKGEIFALAGIVGAGRTEVAQLLFGAAKPTSGEIYFKGEQVHVKSPAQAASYGIALVPEDRKQQGALLDLSVQDNITLASIKKLSKFSVVNKKKEKVIAQEFKESLRIKTPTLTQEVNSLSGGNQQKVVLAKWLATRPELIILDEPTRGIDVGAKHEIYLLMNQLVESGKTIIMITSEMEELIGMADRMVVLCEGVMTAELTQEDFDKEKILYYASSKTGGNESC